MKKMLVLVCVIALVVTNVSGAIVFSDVNKNTEGGKAIYKLVDKGIIEGYGNGLFGPGDSLTRAQAVKIINKIFGYRTPTKIDFKDVPVDEWYYMEVAAAVNAGYIKGYGNGLFGPNDVLTKEHVCVMLDNIMKFIKLPMNVTVKDKISSWAKDSVEKILSNGLATTDSNGNFHATEKISREETCIFLSQFVMEGAGAASPGTGGGGNGSTGSSVSNREREAKIQRIMGGITGDLVNRTDNPNIQSFFMAIAGNMARYLEDPTFDYKGQAENIQKMFRSMKNSEMKEAKNLLVNFFMDDKYAADVADLYDFFF